MWVPLSVGRGPLQPRTCAEGDSSSHASWGRKMPARLLHSALGSQWPRMEVAPGLAGSGALAALGGEPEAGEISCLWQCEATSRY